jgi:hypothetical protein
MDGEYKFLRVTYHYIAASDMMIPKVNAIDCLYNSRNKSLPINFLNLFYIVKLILIFIIIKLIFKLIIKLILILLRTSTTVV